MALPDYEFMDGFDKYGPAGNQNGGVLLDDGEWSSISTTSVAEYQFQAGIVTGQLLRFGSNGNASNNVLSKTLPANYQRCVGGCYMGNNQNSSGAPTSVRFGDANTPQCSITVNMDGTISLRRGTQSGTIIQTYSSKPLSAGQMACIEWDITVHNTTGIAKIWRNGELVINLTGQDLGSTANNYYNQIELTGMTNGFHYYDHFYSWHYLASGGSETPCLTMPVIETNVASADDTIASTVGGVTIGDTGQADSSSVTSGTNRMYLRKVTSDVAGSISSIVLFSTTTVAGCKIKGVVYADNAGIPGALLGTGTEVVGTVASADLVLPFGSPPTIAAGTSYWIGFIADLQPNFRTFSSTAGVVYSRTYTLGPQDPGGVGTASFEYAMFATVTGVTTKFAALNNDFPSAYSYNVLAAAGDKDLYGFPDLSVTPETIYSVAVKALALRSDAGARTVEVRTKAGATENAGSAAAITPGTTSTWITSYWPLNPDTGLAWSGNLNGVKHGIRNAT